MRKIKFRGKRPNGEYVYGDLLRQRSQWLIYDGAYNQVAPETVSQLIAEDANNREVYERDALYYLGSSIMKSATFRDYSAIADGLAVKYVKPS